MTDKAPDFVVCGPWSYFEDDVRTVCARCQAPIVHRPYMPADIPKICIACMNDQLRAEGQAPLFPNLLPKAP